MGESHDLSVFGCCGNLEALRQAGTLKNPVSDSASPGTGSANPRTGQPHNAKSSKFYHASNFERVSPATKRLGNTLVT
ncbi:MAG: hypothetical protein CM1200mP41_00740 [Gammaproteobacteria bacterium]|nr:MAG: hypothetical protein CM1200mP41_00740 [Gammaproteobacteria bacterium]